MMRTHVLVCLTTVVALTAAACKKEEKKPDAPTAVADASAPPRPRPRATDSTARCAGCHGHIGKEWRDSMHARSTLDKDPLYAFMVRKAVKKIGPRAKRRCRQCHYSNATEGVTCPTCHRVHAQHPVKKLASGKAAAFARARKGMSGPAGLCLSCHHEMKTPDGRPVCTTGEESSAAGSKPCNACHMKERPGPPDPKSKRKTHKGHFFPGGHRPDLLKGAAVAIPALKRAGRGRELVVTVQTGDAGHSVPTGNPMRSLTLRVEAVDKDNKIIWQNIRTEGLKEDPKAVFMRVFTDAAGRRPVPPFMSRGPSTDNRLKAGKTRVLRYAVPSGARIMRLRLEYRLAPERILTAAGFSPERIKPFVVHAVTVKIP